MWRAALFVVVLLNAAEEASAHGGGLDAYGCHNNRKAGGYHCHRGALAGQAFSSQSEMLQQRGGGSATKVVPLMTVPPAVEGKSTEERLRELRSLRDKDFITDQEYEAKRRAILDAL